MEQSSLETTRSSGPSPAFTWLHLSDLHAGLPSQDRLLPRYKANLANDLGWLAQKIGRPFDVVIFSGDLVQQGRAEEFARLEDVLDRVLTAIEKNQARPKIITAPGNHDLLRPQTLHPMALALKQYWSNPELQEAICSGQGGYADFIAEVFRNYTEWRKRAIDSGYHAAPQAEGFLPGDAAYTVINESGRLGIAALNSAWLQTSGSDYFGHLHVDVNQLLRITDGDPDEWAKSHDSSLLVTHHPVNWLKHAGLAAWHNEIDPPSRFDAHLFGHMHVPDTITKAHGGSPPRRAIQAASLFGLEKYGDEFERIQGYSACRIERNGVDRTLTCWPRLLVRMTGGSEKFAPDHSQNLDEDSSCFSIPYKAINGQLLAEKTVGETSEVEGRDISPSTIVDLHQLQVGVGEDRAHLRVRRVEQEKLFHALKRDRIGWVSGDWGMGIAGFVSSIRSKFEISQDNLLKFDFSEFQDRESFFSAVQLRVGATFQQICDAISNAGPTILLFDDVNLSASSDQAEVLRDIEGLAEVLAEFASNVFIVITSRRPPRLQKYGLVELRPFDEADLATYVRESSLGDERYSKPEAASKIFRHTDGIPSRIDAALKDLEIISLEDLVSSNSDLSLAVADISSAPVALVSALDEIKNSDDRAQKRSYELLLALAALPQGEQLVRIKRFLGPHQFGPNHARVLLERSLIDTVALPASERVASESTAKALVVPKLVRELVRESTEESVSRDVDRRALGLYFGENWSSGDISGSPTGRRVKEALCDGYEIHNASTIIVRCLSRALLEGDRTEVLQLLRLGISLAQILLVGDHYRSSSSLCEDLLAAIQDGSGWERETGLLNYINARSLRMLGRHAEAKQGFESIDLKLFSKSQRQHVELCLALVLQRLGDDKAAKAAATRAIEINKKSADALHAETILAGYNDDCHARASEYKRLLKIAERRGIDVIANNLRIEMADDDSSDDEESSDLLRDVISGAKSGKDDHYNRVRAIVNLASLSGGLDRFGNLERNLLIDAYHFLYSERMFDLFDRCHAALWDLFERDGDRANLLRLFRHSSFIWRLSGREEKESFYLKRISNNVGDIVAIGVALADRDGAYLAVRLLVVLGQAPRA